MRAAIKKPLTEYGKGLAFGKLEKLKAAGNDPNAVLDQSILNAWQGLFPLRVEGANGHAWWTTEKGTYTQAHELGITERGGESWNDFRGRIWACIRASAQTPSAVPTLRDMKRRIAALRSVDDADAALAVISVWRDAAERRELEGLLRGRRSAIEEAPA